MARPRGLHHRPAASSGGLPGRHDAAQTVQTLRGIAATYRTLARSAARRGDGDTARRCDGHAARTEARLDQLAPSPVVRLRGLADRAAAGGDWEAAAGFEERAIEAEHRADIGGGARGA